MPLVTRLKPAVLFTSVAVLSPLYLTAACLDSELSCEERGLGGNCGESGGSAGFGATGGDAGASASGGSAATGGTGATGGNPPAGGAGGATGGSAGTGGDAGSAGSAGAPGCDCSGNTPVCIEDTGDCVQCTDNTHCSDATPVCNTDSNSCVACTENTHCSGDTPFCDTDSNSCVTCLANDACTDPTASLCEDGQCAPCLNNDDCSHIEGKAVCDAGECVECTPDDPNACGESPCNPLTRLCSEFGTNRLACQTCDTDANCAEADHFCVPTKYMGDDRPTGYCLASSSAGCIEPYSVETAGRTTLSGANGMAFCSINEALATCEAVRALIDNVACPGGTDDECPESGLCRRVGALNNRCTYSCAGASDCSPSGAGSNCGPGMPPAEPSYCGGGPAQDALP